MIVWSSPRLRANSAGSTGSAATNSKLSSAAVSGIGSPPASTQRSPRSMSSWPWTTPLPLLPLALMLGNPVGLKGRTTDMHIQFAQLQAHVLLDNITGHFHHFLGL